MHIRLYQPRTTHRRKGAYASLSVSQKLKTVALISLCPLSVPFASSVCPPFPVPGRAQDCGLWPRPPLRRPAAAHDPQGNGHTLSCIDFQV